MEDCGFHHSIQVNINTLPTCQVMTSPWEPKLKPRPNLQKPVRLVPRRNPINDIRQDQQWQIGTKAFHHIRKQPACHSDRSTDDVKKKQWKMMEHDAKIQVPRWEKLGFNTHHPNPCMGFHCQTCEHFGNGGAWEWNIFSNYCLAVSRVTVDQNTTGLLFIVKPHSQILHIRNVFEIYPLVN